ncbi:hypothetical protein [Kitasatospora sp. KL5]|uniref:hypothetical protein n=1 Tax=Kitasatospora sp. KL5 TaxID=3425125 RepID=UPI003D6E6433
MALLLVVDEFAVLLVAVALTCRGERAAKTLEMLFATRVAGERRGVYQALFRTVADAGYALGAGLAALGPAVGTASAHRALILAWELAVSPAPPRAGASYLGSPGWPGRCRSRWDRCC